MQFVGLAESADEIFIDWTFNLLFLLFLFARAYLDMKELKEILQLDGSTHLNVFFANSSDEDLAGVATWPWDKEALTHLGTKTVHPFISHSLYTLFFCCITTRVSSLQTFRRYRAQPFLLRHLRPHGHHGPRDRPQPRAVPRLSGYIGDRVLQRRLFGDRALDGDRRPVCRH